MMLVEPNFYRPTTTEKTLTGLDKEMQEILHSSVPDDVKIKQYPQALKMFVSYHENQANSAISKKKEEEPEPPRLTESDIMDFCAAESRHKAKRLLEHIKRSTKLKYNNKGEVIFDDQPIAQSNIIDLVETTLKKRTAEKPAGWAEFADFLKEISVPRKIVANDELWRLINPPPPPAIPGPTPPPRTVKASRRRLAQSKVAAEAAAGAAIAAATSSSTPFSSSLASSPPYSAETKPPAAKKRGKNLEGKGVGGVVKGLFCKNWVKY